MGGKISEMLEQLKQKNKHILSHIHTHNHQAKYIQIEIHFIKIYRHKIVNLLLKMAYNHSGKGNYHGINFIIKNLECFKGIVMCTKITSYKSCFGDNIKMNLL